MLIRAISAVASIEEAGPLLVEHWGEVARNKEVMVLKPNVLAYQALEDAGALISLGAFDDGRMVGYAVTICSAHLHYADLIYASNDVIFVAGSHRNGPAGIRLMRETERLALERGARLILWHAKPDTTLDRILPRMGYGVQETVFSRQL